MDQDDFDLEIRVVDALADYLENDAELPRHDVVKYRRPLAVLPDDCPLLCIWLIDKAFRPLTTNFFNGSMNLGISWQQASVMEAQTLRDNPKLAKELLEAIGRIQQSVRNVAVKGWDVLEAYQVYPMRVDYFQSMPVDTGLVEGYLMTVRVDVQEDGGWPG